MVNIRYLSNILKGPNMSEKYVDRSSLIQFCDILWIYSIFGRIWDYRWLMY